MKYLACLSCILAGMFVTSCTGGDKKSSTSQAPEARASSLNDGSIKVEKALASKLGIEVQKVELSAETAAVTATGRLQNDEDASWQVGAMTDGKILSVPIAVGDHVREGQPLANLHSHEVHDARASYRQAVAELQRHKTLADQSLTIRDRTRRLFDLRAASREQLEAAETAYRNASTSVANAEAEVDKTTFHLTEFLEVPLESKGHSDHSSSGDALTIKAPASGTVLERKITAGSVVSTGDPVFVIADLTKLWMIAAVNEADMAHVRPGQAVELRVRAYPDRTFAGRVLRLGERLDPQTRTLQVRVAVPNGHGLLKPEMFANANFAVESSRKVLQAPESAVQQVNGKKIIFVQQGPETYLPHEVTTGAVVNEKVEVLTGVEPGDAIVVKGAFLLRSQLAKQVEQ